MRRIPVDAERPDPKAVARAAAVLADGGIVAFPTETVYGLCVDGGNREAVRRLYDLKGRDAARACAYLLPNPEAAATHAGELPRIARRLAAKFWPGPLTLVVPGKRGKKVGLRLPAPELPRALADVAGRPLLQTSANRSGEPAALDAAGVVAALGAAVDLVLDGGRARGGEGSTVVEVDERAFTLLRPGPISNRRLLLAATELTLVACTGNLCRSPLAEALFRRALAERFRCAPAQVLRFGHRFGSFGTMAMVDLPATKESILVGRDLGVDLTPHRSRPFSIRLLDRARRIYCLARGHREFLAPYLAGRDDRLALLDPNERDIPDPYGRSLRAYRQTGKAIWKAIEARADELAGLADGA